MDFFADEPVTTSPTARNSGGTPTPQSDSRAVLKERGADAVAAQKKEIDERLAKRTQSRQEQEAKAKKAAAELLSKSKDERQDFISQQKRDHQEKQQASLKLRDELASKGALWPSVLTLVDISKPNGHTKRGTELMRSTFIELQAGKCAASRVGLE